VFAGDTVDVTAAIESKGRSSRRLHFEAAVGGQPVCTAVAVAIAKPLTLNGDASGR
jgi:hypothetical protein